METAEMHIDWFRTCAKGAQIVLTIGNFDGVHLGHQALIDRVCREAKRHGASPVLLTFHPHPQSILQGRHAPVLTDLPQRMRLFEEQGLAGVALIPFTQALSRLDAQAFFERYILAHFDLRGIVIGYDFAFGRNREGTATLLRDMAAGHGFFFEVFPAISAEGGIVSSTGIRKALEEGDFPLAERLLGRPYGIAGTVVEGMRQGRELGFATLNLVPEHRLPLPYGVYAVRVRLAGEPWQGVCNYGVRPTALPAAEPTVEVHLFDFSRQAYKEALEVFPVRRLREERRFASLAQLKAQIARDSDQARTLLAAHPLS